jgi:hypothetical protein
MKIKEEKPIKIIPNTWAKHKSETKVFSREIHENFCMQKGCRFYGRHAQQGICHTTKSLIRE